jgi:signal transduction histidine kinase
MRLEIAYRHLEAANARAEESSRMKSDFIQQISHEIRTPLNILSGFAQIITSPDMELDDATRADINRQITENTDRITGMVNKVLELSDAKSQTIIERTDTVTPLEIAVDATDRSGIAKAPHLSYDLQLSPEAKSIKLQTNKTAAVRALSLLLDNARKFTAPPESQQHHDKLQKKNALLFISVVGKQVFFAIEDTGTRIPASEAEHIFEEFIQLDEYYNGTGVGLTLARSLARRIGGDVRLDTAYTAGARFVLTLPYEA